MNSVHVKLAGITGFTVVVVASMTNFVELDTFRFLTILGVSFLALAMVFGNERG